MTTKPKRITRATIKSFVKKNREALLIKVESKFDGMVDGCRDTGDREFSPALKDDGFHQDHTYGIHGAWFVLGGRDHLRAYDDGTYRGYEVYNSCGSFILVIEIEDREAKETRHDLLTGQTS